MSSALSVDSVYFQDISTIYSFDAPIDPEVRERISEMSKSAFESEVGPTLQYSENYCFAVPEAPLSTITCSLQTDDRTLWAGSKDGLARLRDGEWRFFAGPRWLPNNAITNLKLDEQNRLTVTTVGGTSIIESVPTTLDEKAAHYEKITADRHNRSGFVASCTLTTPGDLTTYMHEATDNDGLWTALYICAESFRWQVTGDPIARDLARCSMNALLSLVRVTSIPGFPARAVIRNGERVIQSDPGPNWYASPLDTQLTFKNDTSSDEIDGHYLAWYWYSRLAATPEEKVAISEVCRAVTDHIIDHGYTLVGPTGRPTSWGVWSPEKLNGDPDWYAERGLNSLEILSHLKVAAFLCSEPRYEEAYQRLIQDHGYAQNTVRQKMAPPDGEDNHSDDELAACAYYPLILLETDPVLRATYLESLERTHSILLPQGSPFYNALYSLCTGKPFDTASALTWFREAPWDLRDWRMENSRRSDVEISPELDRFGQVQLTRVLPPSERRVTKWNSNPYAADAGGSGETEEDGTFWLLPYWMCRYHGLI